MYNPISALLPRVVTQDFKLGKYKIFKGTKFSVLIDGIHHCEKYYSDALTFKPERFLKKSDGPAEKNKDPFYSFSVGKRNCLGRHLGNLNVGLVILMIVKRFELKALDNIDYGAVQTSSYYPENCFARIKPIKSC